MTGESPADIDRFRQALRTAERNNRLANKNAYPESYTHCSCGSGCETCGWSGWVSKATARGLPT